jgi:hypothetical protein
MKTTAELLVTAHKETMLANGIGAELARDIIGGPAPDVARWPTSLGYWHSHLSAALCAVMALEERAKGCPPPA